VVDLAAESVSSELGASRTSASGNPLARKLGIRPGARIGLLGAPAGFDATLGELPPGVEIRRSARGPLDVVVAFFSKRSQLERLRLVYRLRDRPQARAQPRRV
jgi:hypothetical protein